MPRIAAVSIADADTATASTLSGLESKLGRVPNLFSTLAQAPAALKGYVAFANALAGGRLTASQREIIALAVAQENQCAYCLAAHTAIGKGAGLNDQQVIDARHGRSADEIDHAIATLAVQIVRRRAVFSDEELSSLRIAGLDDGLVVEIVANVALNVLTNYTNHIAGTVVDFPSVAVEL